MDTMTTAISNARFVWIPVTILIRLALATELTSDMIVEFALRSLGVGNVVRSFAERELADGTLFELRFNKMIPKRHFCVVTADRGEPTAAAKRMLELIRTKDLPERNGNDSYDYF